MAKTVDTLVVGAGPAGLCAGAALAGRGDAVLVIDRGRDLTARRHDTAQDLGEGVGGAGLFSDGKFSFYPSGTQLYALPDEDRLRRAYQWCCALLCGVGIETRTYPAANDMRSASCGDNLKLYPSYYGSLEMRRTLIARMTAALGDRLLPHTTLTNLAAARDGYCASLDRGGVTHTVEARSIVFATGRLGPLADVLRQSGLLAMKPMRYEFGIRIEARHERTFLARHTAPDVKRLQQIDDLEFRTFCTCRRGEVWHIPYGKYAALSGRSDGPATEYSNFGFLVRFTGDKLADGRAAWATMHERVQNHHALYQPLGEFLGEPWPADVRPETRPWNPRAAFRRGDVHAALGPRLGEAMRLGVSDLLRWAPELRDPSTVCLFPSIEGVGEFPEIDAQLRVPGQNIWCAGDLVGTMRGLVPSMVNGYYVGLGVHAARSAARARSRIASPSGHAPVTWDAPE